MSPPRYSRIAQRQCPVCFQKMWTWDLVVPEHTKVVRELNLPVRCGGSTQQLALRWFE